MRPRQDAERAEVRYREHIPGATHGIATEAAITSKHVLEDVIGGIHGEQRGGERDSIPGGLGKQACLDRPHPHDAMRIDEADPYHLQLFFLDLRENAGQSFLTLR